VEEGSDLSDDIVRFVLPIYLTHQRTDVRALKFYFQALTFSLPEEDQLKNILAQSFCYGNLMGVSPGLHRKCKEIFDKLPEAKQAELKSKSDETQILYKLQKIKLFRKEDLQDLKYLKVEMGLVVSKVSLLLDGLAWSVRVFKKSGKWMLLRFLDSAFMFGKLPLKIKLGSFIGMLVFILIGLGFKEILYPIKGQGDFASQKGSFTSTGSSKGNEDNWIYTVQIAAVISAKQANKLVERLKGKGVKGLYVVMSKRIPGGHWFKLRVGQFASKSRANEYANKLVAAKTVRNYFVISLPRK
jgi:hypothetical protein